MNTLLKNSTGTKVGIKPTGMKPTGIKPTGMKPTGMKPTGMNKKSRKLNSKGKGSNGKGSNGKGSNGKGRNGINRNGSNGKGSNGKGIKGKGKVVSKKNNKNRSLVGNMPNFNNSASEIKLSKNGLRKLLKSMFLDMGLEEKEIIDLIRQIGKDEQSVVNLTKLVNKTRKKDTERKAMIIKNMNILKESVLKIYNQFDDLNNNLGILFERKNPQKKIN